MQAAPQGKVWGSRTTLDITLSTCPLPWPSKLVLWPSIAEPARPRQAGQGIKASWEMMLRAGRLEQCSPCLPRRQLQTRGMRGAVCGASHAPASVIADIRESLRTKQRTATEIMQQYLDGLLRVEPSIHSFISIDGEQALKQVGADDLASVPFAMQETFLTCPQAAELDKHISSAGVDNLKPLAGVPVAIKVCGQGLQQRTPCQLAGVLRPARGVDGCRTTFARGGYARQLGPRSCLHSCPPTTQQPLHASALLGP